MDKKTVVWFHANCTDGVCAAWVASQYLPKDTEFIAREYGKHFEIDTLLYGETDLYIVDWCPEDMEELDMLCKLCNSVTIIDHHKSAIEKLDKYYGVIIPPPANLTLFLAHDNEWSGAMGTTIYFASKLPNKEPRLLSHWLVKTVDDYDRWQFKLGDTKRLIESLSLFGFDIQKWITKDWDDVAEYAMIQAGNILLQKKRI